METGIPVGYVGEVTGNARFLLKLIWSGKRKKVKRFSLKIAHGNHPMLLFLLQNVNNFLFLSK